MAHTAPKPHGQRSKGGLKGKVTHPPNVSGTPTALGLYQPRALCAVAPHLLPGLRCEARMEDADK
eukprot:scaffold38122_cov64-Phaeocystis_antarctica.AAC.3